VQNTGGRGPNPVIDRPVDSPATVPAPSLVRMVWRERWIVLAGVLVAGLAGILLSRLPPPVYTAQSRVFLSATGDFDPLNRAPAADPARYVADQVEVLGSGSVLAATIATLHLDLRPGPLRDAVSITAGPDSSVITIRVGSHDPATAEKIADGLPAAYRLYLQRLVEAKVEQATGHNRSPAAVAGLRTAAAIYGDGVSGIEPASRPVRPSSPQPVRNALILALIGLIAGVGYAQYARSGSRRSVDAAEAGTLFGAPVLSEVPDRGRIAAGEAIAPASSPPGDAYRMAAVGLDYLRAAEAGTFLVTGAHDGAGASLTALNLAAAAADHGRRVFLLNIEDSVRARGQADAGVLRVPLHDLVQGRIDLGQVVERRTTGQAQFGIIRLQVIQPVQGHPVSDLRQILDQLPDDTDLVLLDCPPLAASSASFALAGQVEAALVVIDEVTTPADLEELCRRCRLAGLRVSGLLINHIRGRRAAGARRRRTAPVPRPSWVLGADPGVI